MTEKQLDELFPEMILNTNSRVRKKMLGGLPQKKSYWREEVAEIARIDEDTVTNYTKKYDESGLQGLLEENYHPPKSQLEPCTEQLKELFKKQLFHTSRSCNSYSIIKAMKQSLGRLSTALYLRVVI